MLLKYYVLASGSKGNATLVVCNDTILMIDCGVSKQYLTKQLNDIGYQFDDIQYLLLTHDHGDHKKFIHHFKDKLIIADTRSFDKPDIEIQDYQSIQLNQVTIMPIPLSHDSSSIHGLVIETKTQKLVYLTDTGYLPNPLIESISDADYYIIESNHDPELLMKSKRPYFLKQRILSDKGHLSNQDSALIGTQVVGGNTKEIVLAHLSEEANTPESALNTWNNMMETKQIDYRKVTIRVACQTGIVKGGTRED